MNESCILLYVLLLGLFFPIRNLSHLVQPHVGYKTANLVDQTPFAVRYIQVALTGSSFGLKGAELSFFPRSATTRSNTIVIPYPHSTRFLIVS